MNIKYIYLSFSILGLFLPFWPFVNFLEIFGFNVRYAFELLVANHISRFMIIELILASLGFCVLLIIEGKRSQMRHLWVYILCTLCGGLSFALPLFLYFREIRREGVEI